ncbi:MAG: hypothetical protein LH631_02820 [Alkalinema sp. CAN_BIN05]|nr:hypothetical protein [Alkalinema sp. CAN_BIN05]
MQRQAAIEQTNMMSAAQAKIMADQPRLMSEAVQSALKYSSETAGVGFRNFEHPCDYPNQP